MDISTVLPILSIGVAIMAFYFARKKETQEDTQQSTEVIVELRGMRGDMSELKSDFKAMRNEMQRDHDDIVGMKRDFATMWKRIDELKEMIKSEKA